MDVDHEGEVNFKFSPRILKKIDTPENFILLFFFPFYQKSKHGIATAQVFSDHLFLSL